MTEPRCGKTVLARAGAPRMCQLPADHDGPHLVYYRKQPVKVPR